MNPILSQCDRTVGMIEALIYGAGEACVEMGLWNVLALVAIFAAGVTVLQFVLKRLFFGPEADLPRPLEPDLTGAPQSARAAANRRRAAAAGRRLSSAAGG